MLAQRSRRAKDRRGESSQHCNHKSQMAVGEERGELPGHPSRGAKRAAAAELD